jgi:hypothetical protein
MAREPLFEAVTGYPSPTATPGGGPAILGAPVPAPGETEPVRSESQFGPILDELLERADKDPLFAQKLADAWGTPPDREELKRRIRETQDLLRKSNQSKTLGPAGETATVEIPEVLGAPPGFSSAYIAAHVPEKYWKGQPAIDLRPELHRYEDDDPLGWAGWAWFNGLQALDVPRSLKPPFREKFGDIDGAVKFRRHASDDFLHRFPMPADGSPLRIALFADFGTGLGHAQFIARQLALDPFTAAIHLGDVYYTGTPKQYRNNFEEPLAPMIESGTKLFVLPDNHDGYSGFHAYCDFLIRRTDQKGSYFAIETPHVQLIGLDTIWHSERGCIQDAGVRDWLRDRLQAGRQADRTNVLLTGHHPYGYGSADLTQLHADVASIAPDQVDLWFWGNTHYCALFDRTGATRYYGSCIGHAGYPYAKEKLGKKSAAPVRFVETGIRYEGSTVRDDRGMNGFCAFEIAPNGDIDLRYLDWRSHERCRAHFTRAPDGTVALTDVRDFTA